MAGDVVEADVLGEVAEMVGSVWFNLATDARPFSDVILTEIGTCGRLELAGRGAVATACRGKMPVPVEPSPPVWGDEEVAVVVGFAEVGAAALPNGPPVPNGAPVPPKPPEPLELPKPPNPPVPNPGVGV